MSLISPDRYDYAVEEVVRVVDADTFDLRLGIEVDYGFHLTDHKSWKVRIRLAEFDAVEIRSPLGKVATAFAMQWFKEREGILRVTTFKTDNFGRWLGDVYSFDGHLKDALREAGFEKPGDRWA